MGTMSVRWLYAGSFILGACASKTHLPPPIYQEPVLPPWQAPVTEPSEFDFIDAEGGQWVDDEEEEQNSMGGAPGHTSNAASLLQTERRSLAATGMPVVATSRTCRARISGHNWS